MRKENMIQSVVMVMLAVTVLAMSVGFAAFNQTLNINGKATFSKATWDVHFDTTSFSETSTIKSDSTKLQVGNTAISYEVTLPKPGSTYSFTVNAKNYGTIDAALKKITITPVLTEDQKKFISYEVNYNGTKYEATTDNLDVALAGDSTGNGNGATHPVVVTITYKMPTEATALPQEDVTLDMTVALDYEDKAN